MVDFIEEYVKDHIKVVNRTFNKDLILKLDKSGKFIADALKSKGKLLFFGNGGSAAHSQHIAAEFVSKLKFDRNPLAAVALTTDTSILTAIGNDYGFENLFQRQIQALGNAGDIAIGISTSGQSQNVLLGLKAAKEKNLKTIMLTGESDISRLTETLDVVLKVKSIDTAYIQESHIMFGHLLCSIAERYLYEV